MPATPRRSDVVLRRQSRFDIRQAGRPIALVLATVAALNIGGYVLYTRPAVEEYRALLERNKGGFDAVAAREAEVARIEAFRDALVKAESDLRHLRDEVLATREERLVEVHREVADIANEFSIDLNTVSFSNELLVEEELDRLAISVPLEGGYVNLRKFLQAIENSEKFLIVERVGLARGKQGGSLLDLNINMATYFTAPEDVVQRKHERMRERGRRS
jgi:Tfp pilus assembly protein PilO